MSTTRTTRAGLAVAAALAVTSAALITPTTAAAVTATAVSLAGVTPQVELSTDLQVLPAPTTSVARVVVSTPQIPPLPSHTSARDKPALAAHVHVVEAAIADTQIKQVRAAAQLTAAHAAVDHAELRLRHAQTQSVTVGAPVPAAPRPPAVPRVTTTDGTTVPVTDPQGPAAGLGTVRLDTAGLKPSPVVGDVQQQVAAITEGQAAQQQLAAAQETFVVASAVEQVTTAQLSNLDAVLATSRQVLATLPAPDPRWSDGCPTTAPDNTLRNGAADIGIAQLCADSVAGAPTPQAALAIKWALNHLDIPYSQPLRNSAGYADCSSFLSRAYTAGGVPLIHPGVNAPTTKIFAAANWAGHIAYAQAQPGDLVEPEPGHVVMVLAHGFIVHTSTDGDVSHVRSAYFSDPYLTLRIDPAAAGS